MTFKQYEPFRVLELQPDLKVTFPCGHEITIQTNQFLTTTDCEQCKTNQMNPTITLQENGDVIISNTETTTTLSKVTVDEICRLVKEDGEKVKLEVGKWYKSLSEYGSVFEYLGDMKVRGFFRETTWADEWEWIASIEVEPASTATVQQYLKNEFIRLGGKVGAKVECLSSERKKIVKEMTFLFDDNRLYVDCGNCRALVFKNGKFATIIQPETITRSEAEKRYDVKITD